MNKEKQKLWNKIRSSRGLKGEESQLAQDVFSECYDTLTAEVKQLEMSEESAQQHAVKCKAENEKLRLALAAIDKYGEFGLFGCLQMREIENKKLKEALTFYADYEVWKEASCSDECFYLEGDCDDDCQGGKLARTVLKELGNV